MHAPLSLWQRDWLDAYPPDVPSSLSYPRAPVSILLDQAAEQYPQRIGCTLYEQEWTYAQLAHEAYRLARALTKFGAGPNRRIGLLLPNIPEYLVALQAAWLTGATALQLSPLYIAEEVDRWLKLTDCRLVITLDLFAPLLTDALEKGPLEHLILTSLAERLPPTRGWLYRAERLRRRGPFRLSDNGRVHRYASLVHGSAHFTPPAINPEEDVAVLAPTGGTTASPKAVMLTHHNLIANALQIAAWSRGDAAGDGVLAVLPLFHAYGLSACVLSSLARAATMHLLPRFESRAALDVLIRRRPAMVPAVPAMLSALNRVLKEKPADLSFIRSVVSGASALDANVRADFDKYHPQYIMEGYGLSEASPVTHVNPFGPGNRAGCIGLPLPDTDARVVDPEDGQEEMPIGTPGELIVRGPQVMKGYYQNPTETALSIRDGWLYTGDLARRDREGFFTIVDRKKDIIKTSGFLVFPAEIEEVIARFPGVAEAAVVGVPDAERGETIKALIVPHVGVHLEMAALEQFCTQHLGKHKRPRSLEIVTALPKNFLGKVQRRLLR